MTARLQFHTFCLVSFLILRNEVDHDRNKLNSTFEKIGSIAFFPTSGCVRVFFPFCSSCSSLSLSHCLSLSLSVSLSLSLYVSVCLSVSLCLCMSLSVCLSLSLSLCLCLCLALCLSVCLSVSPNNLALFIDTLELDLWYQQTITHWHKTFLEHRW